MTVLIDRVDPVEAGRSTSRRLLIVLGSLALSASACGADAVQPVEEAQLCSPHAETTPQAQSIDAVGLKAAYDQVAQLPDLHSFLVVRNDLIVCEGYFRGFESSDAVNVKSASKSILSALVGIAIDVGLVTDLDAPIAPYFPEFYPDSVDDVRKTQVTIRDLLTMQGGWGWTENGQVTLDWLQSANRNLFALGLPMVDDPGTVFNYTTAGTHLLATLLGRAVPGDLGAWAHDRLFSRVGMKVTSSPW